MAKAPVDPTAPVSITITQTEGSLLIAALDTHISHLAALTVGAQQQIDNPSFLNPQVDHYTAMRDDAKAQGQQAIELQAEIAGELSWPLADIASLVNERIRQTFAISPSVFEGTEGPAELNRPPSANGGLANSDQV